MYLENRKWTNIELMDVKQNIFTNKMFMPPLVHEVDGDLT